MRILRVWIDHYKGVSTDFEWAPAVVLFGPNDAGKSNIVEALAIAFGDDRDVRVDRLSDTDPGGNLSFVAEVMLEYAEIQGHPDRQLLTNVLSPPEDDKKQSDLDVLLQRLRDDSLSDARGQTDHWDLVGADFEVLLDARLRSRRLVIFGESLVGWANP